MHLNYMECSETDDEDDEGCQPSPLRLLEQDEEMTGLKVLKLLSSSFPWTHPTSRCYHQTRLINDILIGLGKY